MRRDLIATGVMAPVMFALTGARPVWAGSGGGIPQPTAARQLLDVEGIAVEKRTLAYKQAGECPILADLYTLPKVKRAPTLVWLHGGALIWGSRTSLPSWQLALYLQAGFQVVAIDYRLAPETPLDHMRSVAQGGVRSRSGSRSCLVRTLLPGASRRPTISADIPPTRRRRHGCTVRPVRSDGRPAETATGSTDVVADERLWPRLRPHGQGPCGSEDQARLRRGAGLPARSCSVRPPEARWVSTCRASFWDGTRAAFDLALDGGEA